MPFTKRSIEPVKIRQGALEKSDISLGEEHEVIVNKSYTQILLQLSQLATFANEIFKDLSQECQGVITKSQKLKTRVWEIEQRSKRLNVLETSLPESTLEDVGLETRETTPVHPKQETGLFTSVTRPESVQRLYLKADITPRAVFASMGPQGWKAAKKFCLTPVLKHPGETTYTITKHERAPYKIAYERNDNLKPPRPRPRSSAPRPQSCAGILDYQHQSGKSVLPTPEETVLRSAKSQPSILVPIDTSATAFERFAQTRASLRNIQSHRHLYHESTNSLTRFDSRRQTISVSSDIRCRCEETMPAPTEKILELSSVKTEKQSKRKNPDLYIEDNAALFDLERSRSKEKRESVIKKLVRRSKSLPRNIGREKSRETLVPPDFYDIHPQHSVIVSENGAFINDKNEKVYTNFYGAPNTELPSPQLLEKMRKSKSDHQINDRLRSKSSSAMEDHKVKRSAGSKNRPRSVSAERSLSTQRGDLDDRTYNSLSRTFTGLFGKGKKSKTIPANSSAHSRDSINTVFTSNSDGEAVRRQGKRLSSQTMLSTQITLRKRDSKATTSSSGRWSGSERFSMDSDGLFSATSQHRLSRVSADRDSALGADINDSRTCSDESKPSPTGETHSLYSVDQDGFFTTMHTDIRMLEEDKHRVTDVSDDVEDTFANLSLLTSSACTSTHTLNEQEKATPVYNHNSSIGSVPDSEQAEEIALMVKSKVEAGRSINRYSLVVTMSDDDEEDEKIMPAKPNTTHSITRASKSNLKQSQTYESELDLVLEDVSETGTIHSDSESVVSLRVSCRDNQPKPATRKDAATMNVKSTTPLSMRTERENNSKPLSDQNEKLLKYKLLNGCAKYQKLPYSSVEDIIERGDNSRTCKSLPRNMKNVIANGKLNGLISTLDNMGSWPRKFSRINPELDKDMQSNRDNSPSGSNSGNINQQPLYSKRRSLSPGKAKTNEKTEKIHSLIEEARRMSSIVEGSTPDRSVKRPHRPLSQPESLLNQTQLPDTPTDSSRELVSPYATSVVMKTSSEAFKRQPSYKIACSNEVTPRKVLPRSYSEDGPGMRRNYSYRLANKSLRTQTSDSILEHHMLESSPEHSETRGFVRAPSYKLAQSQSFDRSNRAPSYRRALETIPCERDSGLGSSDMTSSGSIMTSSSESNQSETGRQSSYRLATAGDATIPTLNHGTIKDCMKGVYENEESHLSKPLSVPSKPELVQISMKNDIHHYSVPRIPAQKTSFNPEYVNIGVGVKSKQAYKKSLQPSKSAPQPAAEDTEAINRSSLENGKCLTPPARSVSRKPRPMSSYVPNGEDCDTVVPDNRLMLPKYNQSAFPSMEMLKREEMAVMSVLGKIRRSTRPLSYVQTDI